MIKINELDHELLKRYVAARHRVQQVTDEINSLSYLLSLLKHSSDSLIPVDPQVFAETANQINRLASMIPEELDRFIYSLEAEEALEIKT